MANIPEFISALRDIRDRIFPAITQLEADTGASATASANSATESSGSADASSASAVASSGSADASSVSAGESLASAEASAISAAEALASQVAVEGVQVDIDYIQNAREATGEPNGYNHSLPNEMGILELCVLNPDDNLYFKIYGIDQNGLKIATRTVLKTAATWGNGVDINETIDYQLCQYPVSGVAPVAWWINGAKYESTLNEVVELIPTSGHKYVYRDAVGLKVINSFTKDLYTKQAYTSSIYGNHLTGDKIVFSNERHGIQMDGETHYLHHVGDGTEYVSGYGIVGLAEDSGVYTHVDSGEYMDEDITSITPIQTDAPFWYIVGDIWTSENDGVELSHITATRPNYNLNTGGTWSLQEMTNNKYILVHFFATNDVEFPIVKVLGQIEYGNATDARDGAINELNSMFLVGIPSEEYIPLYSIILNDLGNLVLNSSGDTAVDWRRIIIISSSTSGDVLPSQVGNENLFLTTNGVNASWADVDLFLGGIVDA